MVYPPEYVMVPPVAWTDEIPMYAASPVPTIVTDDITPPLKSVSDFSVQVVAAYRFFAEFTPQIAGLRMTRTGRTTAARRVRTARNKNPEVLGFLGYSGLIRFGVTARKALRAIS
jgi:hypothetical protein